MSDALDDFLDRLTGGVESTGDPRAKNPKSSASGAFQFTDPTWHALGNPGRAMDAPPEVQRAQARALAQQNASLLQRYGIPLDDNTQYLAWQQGPAGARALLADPDDTAIEALTKAGVKNAEAAVLNNGGTRDMKASEFARRVEGRFSGAKMPAVATDSTTAMPPYLQTLIGLQNPSADVASAQAAADKARGVEAGALKAGENKREGLEGALSTPAPGAPDQQQVGAEPKEEPGDPTRVLGQFLPLMAILGGTLARGHSFAALKAATGAMKAAKSNDEEALARHHQEWLDAMQQIKANNEAAQTKFHDAMESWDNNRAEAVNKLGLIAAEEGNSAMQAALATGNFEEAMSQWKMREQVAGDLAGIYDRAAALKATTDRTPPATQAYNEAHDSYLKDHPGDTIGAERAAGDAVKDIELDLKPGALGTQERAAKASFMKEPDVQFYQKAQPYFAIIDDVLANPDRKQTNAEQIQILDAFTKTATGGQAIRRFMAQAGVDSQSYLSQLEVQKSKLTANNGLTLDPKVMLQYAQAAKIARDAQQDLYDKKLADDANASIRQQLDPTDIYPTEDLDRAVQKGLVKMPSQSAAAPDAHPTMSPDEVKQSVLNAREALRVHPDKRAQIEQKLRDNHIDPAVALGNN